MKIRKIFDNGLNELSEFRNFSPHINNMMSQMYNNIIKSEIVSQKNKQIFKKYFEFANENVIRGGFGGSSKNKNINTDDITDMMVSIAAYSISNLNRYDYILVNKSIDNGLNVGETIELILIDNLDDINNFCNKKSIHGDTRHTLVTLKKLSALYKLQYSF